MNKRIILLFSLFWFCYSNTMNAQQEMRTEALVHFRIGSSKLDYSFGNNAARLSNLISYLREIKQDRDSKLTEISFSGYASPDGGMNINKRLSQARLNTLETYVRERVTIPDNVVINKKSGIAWDQLTKLIEESDVSYKNDALYILCEVPEYTFDKHGKLIDSRKKHLMDLRGGRAWHDMEKKFFKQLRNACSIVVSVKSIKTKVKPETVVTDIITNTSIVVNETPERTINTDTTTTQTEIFNPFFIGLKTNLIQDLLGVPNIGIDVYLGKNWSLVSNWMYGWWKKNRTHDYWRIYGGDLGIRKWFGKKAEEKPLTGHHIGIYGQIFTYDFELGGDGYMGGRPGGTLWEKMNYAAGIEYGYSLPIARRLNFDFSIGIGYWGGKYYKYSPLDNHYVWKSTKQRHWFGPTKAEVSLVWLLGHSNVNKK